MGRKIAKSKRPEAERAAEHFCREILECIHTRRAFRTKYAAVDFFASDVLGMRDDGSKVWVQATAGQDSAVSQRRKKLEKYPWAANDEVYVVQLRSTENPANARQKLWFFRVHKYVPYSGKRAWITWPDAVPVPKEWFKAWKENDG